MGVDQLVLNCGPVLLVIAVTVMALKALPDVGILKCPNCGGDKKGEK